ncbi:MAG: helix-turn-helix domain-containing protein [Actinophytocola sp.]|uniref:IclR family transcriptional regulator domain-containing protein n=1 Tax=Actinophytocola sp. TaxID=1872138 RepID=UPI001326EEBB|nr:IclR family transcriptional regulator C-terminal domain-containing protein [Actinophytocola sp.]MPZ85040.1 helix-turn-helix domain-containing protein [Actinophytocola sp.]
MKDPEDKDYVQSLERGLSVILAFAGNRPLLTTARLAEVTGLSRPTVRRLVLTLERLGYVRAEGRAYALTPHVLALGHAFTSSLNLTEIAEAPMVAATETIGHTCSLIALDGEDAVFLFRVPPRRGMPHTLLPGTRMPAYATAAGRVLLAGQSSLPDGPFPALTPATVTDPARLAAVVAEVAERGWAVVDQEYEEGVRSFSAPIRDSAGWVVAALGMSVPASVSLDRIRCDYVPALVTAAARISDALGAGYHPTTRAV